jgi:uncharacterized protein YerC
VPHLSKRKIDPKIEKYISTALIESLKGMKSEEEVDNLVSSVFSETEKVMFAKRFVAAFLIKKGLESKTIADTLKLTTETVARVKTSLKLNPAGFNNVIKRLENMEKKEAVKNVLYKILDYAIRAGAGHIPLPKIK